MEENSEEIHQRHLYTSADPRQIGTYGRETIILIPEELCKTKTIQQSIDNQSVRLTTDQAGFPLTMDKEELVNNKDEQMGRPTTHIHPEIYPSGGISPRWRNNPSQIMYQVTVGHVDKHYFC